MYRYGINDAKKLAEFVKTVTDPNPLSKRRVELEEELLRSGRLTIADVQAYMGAFDAARSAGQVSDAQHRALRSWLTNLVKQHAVPQRSVTTGPAPTGKTRV